MLRSEMKHLKLAINDETVKTGLNIERRQRISFIKNQLGRLGENWFLSTKAKETAELERLIDEINAVKKTKPYDWQTAKSLYEQTNKFIDTQKTLASFDTVRLWMNLKGL